MAREVQTYAMARRQIGANGFPIGGRSEKSVEKNER
jgi:hypothetical protein